MKGAERNLRASLRILTLVKDHPLLFTEDLVSEALTDSELKHVPAAKVRNELLRLTNMHFVERRVIDQEHPLSGSKWEITNEGKNFLNFFEKFEERMHAFLFVHPHEEFETKIVVTMPHELGSTIQKYGEYAISTRDCLELMMRNTSSNVKIATPYFDETLVFVLDYLKPEINIDILSYETPIEVAAADTKRRLLIRMKQRFRHFECKNFSKYVGGVQIYIPHAKTYISDNKRLVITSANLRQTSLLDNFEMGVYTEDPRLVAIATDIFSEVWKNAAEFRFL
jgi:hypothetical protein